MIRLIGWLPLLTMFPMLASACSGSDDAVNPSASVSTATLTASATPVATASPSVTPEGNGVLINGYIGVATMEEDGTIVLMLRAELPSGGVGEGTFTYPPDHPQYQNILDHVGPLTPGETVNVLPFPE